MERLHGISQVGSKYDHNGSYKREAERDLTAEMEEEKVIWWWNRFKDAMLLAVKLQEGAMSQEMQEMQLLRLE